MSTLEPHARRAGTRCRHCHAAIVFATTEAGKAMPLDPTPSLAGNVAAYVDGAGRVLARVATAARPLQPWEGQYLAHFATCPRQQRPARSGPSTEAAGELAPVVPLYLARAARQRRAEQGRS